MDTPLTNAQSISKGRKMNDQSDQTHSSYTPTSRQLTLSWLDVNVNIHEPNSLVSRRLLKNVAGIARPGQLMAILGGSGAGKTTMLNIISGRLKNSDVLTFDGKIRLNSHSINDRTDILRRLTAFVEQDDVFPGFLTVGEHLWFNAKLRMTRSKTTDIERQRRINALLAELNLTLVKDTLIGYPEMGMKTLSGGERKRLSVATELLANAPLLLLDEPTTGLDSFTSESVISALNQLAQLGKTIVFTIHQPSSELFKFFDRLYLLSEGYVCFHGNAKDAANFFAAPPIERPCPLSYNPADFFLDILSRPNLLLHIEKQITDSNSVVSEMEIHAKFINETFTKSQYGELLFEELTNIPRRTTDEDKAAEDAVLAMIQPSPSNGTQFRWLTWRAAKTFYRSPQWMRIRIGEVIAFSLFFGLIYWNLSLSPRDVMNRGGLAYNVMGMNCWDNIDAYALSIPYERNFLLRENQAGLYSLAAYFLGRQLVEIPLLLMLSIFQTTVMSLMGNLWSTVDALGIIVMQVAVFLAGVAASSIGYVIGFMSDNIAVVITFRRVVVVVLVLCNGYYVNIPSVAAYLQWIIRCSFFYYALEAVFIAEWINVGELECPTIDDDDGNNSTNSGGYTDPSCFPNGRSILDYYGFGDMSTAVIDLIVLVGMIILWRLFAFVVLYYRVYSQVIKATLRKKLCHNVQH